MNSIIVIMVVHKKQLIEETQQRTLSLPRLGPQIVEDE